MRSNYLKAVKTAVFAVTILLLGACTAVAQGTVNLSAQPAALTTPDGNTVQMWGYVCSDAGSGGASCAALNTAGAWSPVVITVPYAGTSTSLTINLTNNLPAAVAETSLVIVGQLGGGGGLGSTATAQPSPDHSMAQQTTWPIASPGAANTPPAQGNRVQSFASPAVHGTPASLTWNNLRPGTYLIESGTYPSIQGPMGLYGMLVVTAAPTSGGPGTAYPAAGATAAVTYSAEVPLLLSEIDPVQNNTVAAAVATAGFTEQAVWSGQIGGCGNPKSTTYLQCYPPAVNYSPLYYMINGVAFSKNNPSASLFNVTTGTATGAVTGDVLVRIVNAGLRMHVPSIVGSQAPSGAGGMALIAEDGNVLPGVPRVQSEVFMPAGKTYDVKITPPAAGGTALPIFDRELSLSGNATARDAGMLAYIGVNGNGLPSAALAGVGTAKANADQYFLVQGQTLTVSDLAKGVIANDVNIYGVQVQTAPVGGSLALNRDGTFVYVPNSGTASDSFTYCGNGASTGTQCATVTLAACSASPCLEANTGITLNDDAYTSKLSTALSIAPPGVLANDADAGGHSLAAALASATNLNVLLNPDGSFTASPNGAATAVCPAALNVPAGLQCYSFTYSAKNSQGTPSSGTATVYLAFLPGSNLQVKVLDGADKSTVITDYRWVIEEDRTFYIDPTCTTNPPPSGCPGSGGGKIVSTFGTNFHTSYMPLVATGCTGPLSCESGQTLLGQPAVCDIGNGICRTTGSQEAVHLPGEVNLDPTKRYYISVLPGDAANPFIGGNGSAPASCSLGAYNQNDPSGTGLNTACGHGMGGAPIGIDPNTHAQQTSVTILTQPSPYPPAKLSVFVFEDDFPLNGEQDGGGGIDVLSPNEPGLGGFNITLFDDAGGTGDATGQMTYDMFNMPLSNSLAGTIDPATGLDACPVGNNPYGTDKAAAQQLAAQEQSSAQGPGNLGMTGTIVTCPKYESDGTTLSPLAGQAVIANMMPGRYGVVATPAADRIARGEEWLQTNTLDGQKAHDSFLRIGEPSFFQEFGPAGYHVSIGFANPNIINARKQYVCNGTDPNISGSNCQNGITGHVSTERMSRTPDERLYGSGSYDSFGFTQCFVSFGDPDGMDFAFTKCDSNGNFTLSGLPDGDWRVTVFDQWNDMLVDGLSTPVRLGGSSVTDMGEIAMNQWQSNIYTKTFFDLNGNGIQDSNEDGLALVATNNRFRDGSYSNFNNTDLFGNAGFNEIFPLFSWYVIETDTTRYKSTGAHVVYDAGGPADGTCNDSSCGGSAIGANMANTAEAISLPADLRIPGSFYCSIADCTDASSPFAPGGNGGTTGRLDPPTPFGSYGWQGFSGQNNFIEFGKKPFAPAETGGIHGEVIYASTRPFDDPGLLIHTSWTPDVPGVTINLYQEVTAADGTTGLHLVDTTKTSSWDDYAQGFYPNTSAGSGASLGGRPYMNCPGQGASSGTNADLFFFTLYNQPMWLDVYANAGTPANTVPYNAQYKCFDGMHNWNQVQPAPYDGYYTFPSITSIDLTTGKFNGTHCHMQTTAEPWGCVPNPTLMPNPTANPPIDPTDPRVDAFRSGTPMLPAGKYVVEMIVPPGYELVKEEDKNILIGDNYIAPVTQQFGGLGSIFILPDQAEVSASTTAGCTVVQGGYQCNPQNGTQSLGRTTLPSKEGDTGSVETFWPCVGASRVVPDFISLFPQSGEVSPFAGATRNLCDRKEVTLTEQTAALAKFWIFTSAHVAAHFTGVITDDFTSEFDPFSPQFGEKFSPPNLPVALKDWSGTEVSRVYSDQWGTYNGLTYSTWEVNPPNPTGYGPTMMVVCMNDPGPILDTRVGSPTNGQMITDPLYNPQYSQFCYEIPFMPGQTQYMDTPVVPTSAFAGAGYNNPDCAYPAATPAVSEVDGDGVGPWVSAAGNTLTITALGDQMVPNNAYTGPSATAPPFDAKKVARHYGFGTQCTSPTAGSAACNTSSSVSIGGVNAPVTSWNDSTITVTAPAGVPACGIQQQQVYGGSTAFCGELVITAGNGKQSIDAVTVTIGGKAPTRVTGQTPMSPTGVGSIQQAIDAAQPGDLIIVPPGTYNEILQMWKPVRLQGVGAASSIINANTQPAGKLDIWRARIDCLFGLGLNGSPSTWDATCGSGWTAWAATPINPQVDRLPLEAAVGWDATLNGNLAELLQEPSLMGALEGAAITVLSKGVDFRSNPWDSSLAAGFPTDTLLLTSSPRFCGAGNAVNQFPSSFWCNPSSIDGLGITDSSQGGGGIFIHGWGHNLQVANNRINSNAGTLSGGINVGQGEFPGAYTSGAGATNAPPGSCQTGNGLPANTQLPYCFDEFVNIHNNAITNNSSTGDELFSATPAGAGAVSFCTGSDYYAFNYNWVCGNLSTGDGGGIGQLGFVYHNGPDTANQHFTDGIRHNTIIFNQSTNPTIPANGGGIVIMGTPDVDPTCGATTDQDCLNPVAVGPSDGIGPGLVLDANLIMGNAAEAGSGGGLRLQNINGTDVVTFPTSPSRWWQVNVTNNVIVNNVAGWDGAGISLVDALNTNIINNTVVSNDSTGSAGVLFNTLGAPIASSQGPCPVARNADGTCPVQVTTSTPQPAGLVSIQNSSNLAGNLPSQITCPAGHFAGNNASNGSCRTVSYPELYNNVFFQNRSYFIGVGPLGAGTQNQQNVVSLFNGSGTAPASQTSTGACVSGSYYWDIGVRGDTGPTNHASGVTLNPEASVLTSTTGYNTTTGGGFRGNTSSNPQVVSQYCNGSRVPPEAGGLGYQVPPGISDATVPNPIFNLTPAATVDEGNNWVNISWGPLALTNPVTNAVLGNYAPSSSSPVINYVCPSGAPSCPNASTTTYNAAPATDFFGNLRKTNNHVDVGAIEFQGVMAAPTLTGISPDHHTRGGAGFTVTLTGTNLTGTSALTVSPAANVTVSNVTVVNDTTVTATFTISATATLGARNVTVTTGGGTSNAVVFNIVAPTLSQVSPSTGVRGSSVPVTLTGTNLSAATGVTVSGGIGVSNFTVMNDTTITATFNISSGASLGAGHNVTVVVPGGNTGTLPFTVTGATISFSGLNLTTSPANTTIKSGFVTITNTATGANAGPLTLSADPTVIKVSGPAASSFTVISGGTCVSGAVVNPNGGNCTVNVQYNPGGSTSTSTAHIRITGSGINPNPLNGPNTINGN